MQREGYWGSFLLYGPAGAGKTKWPVSAFWDGKREIARGKWVTFGREDNPFLLVPESCRTTASGASLRFKSPNLEDQNWLKKFDTFTKALLDQCRRDHPLDVLVIDGLSEFDLLYENTFPQGSGRENNFAKWMGLMDAFFAALQRLDPDELGCHVIVTARVMQRRVDDDEARAVKAGEIMPLPDFMPSIKGSFKDNLSHYFNNVFYLHTLPGQTKTAPPQHTLNVLTNGNYLTKLQGETEWLAAKYPRTLVNSNFYDVQHRLENILALPHVLPKEGAADPQSNTETENNEEK